VDLDHLNLRVRDAVGAMHAELTAADVPAVDVQGFRPDEQHVTFRCWDPDGTEIEVYWEAS